MSDERRLARTRLELLASDVRARRAAGWKPDYEELLDAIRLLPPQQAAVMELVFVEGKSVLAAARKLSIHHSTAQEHVRAATLNLGALLT